MHPKDLRFILEVNSQGFSNSSWLCFIAFPSKRQVHMITSPPTPLLSKERGDKAQLYRGEVKVYLTCLGNAISQKAISYPSSEIQMHPLPSLAHLHGKMV